MRLDNGESHTARFLVDATRRGAMLARASRIVEADETYYGNRETPHVSPQRRGRPFTKKGKGANKRSIVALVERGGNVRTFRVAVADKVTVTNIVTDNIAKESRLHTDESKLYFGADKHPNTLISLPLSGHNRHGGSCCWPRPSRE